MTISLLMKFLRSYTAVFKVFFNLTCWVSVDGLMLVDGDHADTSHFVIQNRRRHTHEAFTIEFLNERNA